MKTRRGWSVVLGPAPVEEGAREGDGGPRGHDDRVAWVASCDGRGSEPSGWHRWTGRSTRVRRPAPPRPPPRRVGGQPGRAGQGLLSVGRASLRTHSRHPDLALCRPRARTRRRVHRPCAVVGGLPARPRGSGRDLPARPSPTPERSDRAVLTPPGPGPARAPRCPLPRAARGRSGRRHPFQRRAALPAARGVAGVSRQRRHRRRRRCSSSGRQGRSSPARRPRRRQPRPPEPTRPRATPWSSASSTTSPTWAACATSSPSAAATGRSSPHTFDVLYIDADSRDENRLDGWPAGRRRGATSCGSSLVRMTGFRRRPGSTPGRRTASGERGR